MEVSKPFSHPAKKGKEKTQTKTERKPKPKQKVLDIKISAFFSLTGVGRVRVRPDHHPSRESVVLQDDLVDDPGPGPPEPDPVLGAGRRQKVVDLAVGLDGQLQIGDAAEAAAAVLLRGRRPLNQVVAVDGGRDGGARQARRNELQNGHLRCRILHRDSVRPQAQVGDAALDVLALGVVEVTVDDLFFCFRLDQREKRGKEREEEVSKRERKKKAGVEKKKKKPKQKKKSAMKS